MEQGQFVILLVQTIGLLAPMVILFYNQGKYRGTTDQILKEHTKDINGIGTKVSGIQNEQFNTLTELKAQMDAMNVTLAKVTSSLEWIGKHVDELRRGGE